MKRLLYGLLAFIFGPPIVVVEMFYGTIPLATVDTCVDLIVLEQNGDLLYECDSIHLDTHAGAEPYFIHSTSVEVRGIRARKARRLAYNLENKTRDRATA